MMQRLGDYIRPVDVRNRDLKVERLLGISVTKEFIPSIANTIGTDMSVYKVVYPRQFVYISDTSRRGDKIAIAYLKENEEPALVSAIYTVFEIADTNALDPEYLMMWFRRPEFDRYARFHSHGSAREVFDWDEMCEVQVPVPDIKEQRNIVAEYKTLQTRIDTNKKLIATLEQTAQTLYRHTFVDNIDPNNLPEGWRMGTLGEIVEVNPRLSLKKDEVCPFIEMDFLPTMGYGVTEVAKRPFAGGAKFQNGDVLFARITPCMENGKVAVVDSLEENEVGAGSTEFIVLRGKYRPLTGLLAAIVRNEEFRVYAKAHQTGSDGRQRVESSSIPLFDTVIPDEQTLEKTEKQLSALLKHSLQLNKENQTLTQMQTLLLSKMGA